MLVTGRSATGMGVRWVKRAMQMARRLLAAKLRYDSKHEVVDGYLLSAIRTNTRARGTVLDLPQHVLCPNLARGAVGLGDLISEGLSFPSTVRDLWQPDYLPDITDPKLPTLKRGAWRLATNSGYAFGGEGAGWGQVLTSGAAANVPYGDGTGTTVHQVNGVGETGFYNAESPSLQRFFTRFWASWVSADQETVLAGGSIPISEKHTRAIMFDTAFVDTLAGGWVAIPRASPEFTLANPPAWSNSAGIWGRSYRIKAVEQSDTPAAVKYVMLARLFNDGVNGASSKPYHEAGAVLVATSEVSASLVEGDYQHAGSLLGAQVYSTARPSRFRSPEACAVTDGVHVLLHADVIHDEQTPDLLFGENTYTVVCAKAVGDGIALSFLAIDRDNDTNASRQFYGGISPDGVTSYFLYPAFNQGSPMMSVLACNGASVTLTNVATPAPFQLPGWGYTVTTGLVCHIGAGKLGFVVTLAAKPESGDLPVTPFDVTFCTYNTLSGAVEIIGRIALATLLYVPGYPCTAGGIGAITVVQEEVLNDEGEVLTRAVLLWTTSSGLSVGAGGKNFVGATYISYDSGASWHSISDTVGDFRGVVFVGSQLRPATPGHAWFAP